MKQQFPILDGYKYLRPVRTSGTRPPLFCFFPGLPGASDLADSLPEDQPVYQFVYPKLDGLSQFPAVEELASDYVMDIRKIQSHGPYQLCGHSRSGLLAYETARLLCAQGESVPFLALFETWHPRYVQDMKLLESAQYHFSYVIDRVTKYCRDLTSREFGNFGVRATTAITRRIVPMGWRAVRFFFKSSNRPVPLSLQETESTVVLKDYVPKPYANRLFLVRTQDQFEMRLIDQTFGWQKCATGGVEIFFVLGNHVTMIDKPYVRSLAEKIGPHLSDAVRKSG